MGPAGDGGTHSPGPWGEAGLGGRFLQKQAELWWRGSVEQECVRAEHGVSEGEGKLPGFEKRTWREWGPGSPGGQRWSLHEDWEEVARAPTRTVTLRHLDH